MDFTEKSTLQRAFFWQGQKDSNPQERFWRPLCYHYIMPLFSLQAVSYHSRKQNASYFFGLHELHDIVVQIAVGDALDLGGRKALRKQCVKKRRRIGRVT